MRFSTRLPQLIRPAQLRSRGRVAMLALGLLLATASAALAQVPMINLHHNTSTGAPAAPYAIGTAVTVRGVVTVGVGTFTGTYTDVYLMDATAGINVYKVGTPPFQFQIGDSVTVAGTVGQYFGTTEVVMTTWTLHASGVALPEPLVVTCSDVTNAFLPDYSEPNEARFVRLNGVTWSGTWPSGSGSVTLHDETGDCVLYIDQDTGIQNMTPPGGEFDVMGIIKQYDSSSPYTTGYELLPRSAADFVLPAGPQILAGPVETDIQSNQVTIYFETDTETTASVDFGETASYELGSATDGSTSTVHNVVLAGLDPATVHHYRVHVTDAVGETVTPDRLFCSGSAPGCTGFMRAIFNKSVDTSLATDEQALGSQDFPGWLIDQIDAAQYTIDVVIYSFNMANVADALIAAKDRGVQIRFIYDDRDGDPYQDQVIRLQNNGIWVIDDSFGDNSGSGIMHDKIWIFDANSADPADPWVFTGSWNVTQEGTYTDAQNLLMIQDQALAQVYWLEFNEMWGSSTAFPNSDLSRFGTNKTDNTPKHFNIGGREVQLYFSPSDAWMPEMIHTVDAAQQSTFFCILSFTRYDLGNAMKWRYYDVPGFAVRGVFDNGEGGNPDSEYESMTGQGDYPWDPVADVWLDGQAGLLHHKYLLIDSQSTGGDPVVVTGSANWSTSAMTANDENIILVHDATLANVYLQEFAERYHIAGGTNPLAADVPAGEPSGALAFRAGPNPVVDGLHGAFTLGTRGRVTCDLVGVDGRLVGRLLDRECVPGAYAVEWAQDDRAPLPAGIYFLRLDTPDGQITRRITLVR